MKMKKSIKITENELINMIEKIVKDSEEFDDSIGYNKFTVEHHV